LRWLTSVLHFTFPTESNHLLESNERDEAPLPSGLETRCQELVMKISILCSAMFAVVVCCVLSGCGAGLENAGQSAVAANKPLDRFDRGCAHFW
jgi:hypothetical protein